MFPTTRMEPSLRPSKRQPCAAPLPLPQRVAATSALGEEMVLTFQLDLEESLEPKYRGISCVRRWFLKRVSGEPVDVDLPTAPSSAVGPESVVLAQLEALRCVGKGLAGYVSVMGKGR